MSWRAVNAPGIATDIHFTEKNTVDFQEDSNTCGETLGAGSSCEFTGHLTPQTAGRTVLEILFNYHEGKSVSLQTQTEVANNVVVKGTITQALPKIIAMNTPYKAIFKFHNTGTSAAHDLKVKSSDNSMIITDNTCEDILAGDQICEVTGKFNTAEKGPHQTGVSLSYSEGNDVDLTMSTQVGKALLIAVGQKGYVGISEDGKIWQKKDLENNINLISITWSDDLGKYLAVGTQGKDGIAMLTAGGETWGSHPTSSSSPKRVIWNKDLQQFITVGGAGIVETSPDGEHWTRHIVPVKSDLNSVVWNTALQQYVIVGAENAILTSSNGIDWQTQSFTSSNDLDLTGIAWSDSLKQYIVVTAAKKVFLTSADGKMWNAYDNPAIDQPANDVAWSPDLYEFALGGRFSTICTSRTGTTWIKRHSVPEELLPFAINNIIWSHSFKAFYAVDLNAQLYTSHNAVNWITSVLDADLKADDRGIAGISDGVVLFDVANELKR